MIIVCFS